MLAPAPRRRPIRLTDRAWTILAVLTFAAGACAPTIDTLIWS